MPMGIRTYIGGLSEPHYLGKAGVTRKHLQSAINALSERIAAPAHPEDRAHDRFLKIILNHEQEILAPKKHLDQSARNLLVSSIRRKQKAASERIVKIRKWEAEPDEDGNGFLSGLYQSEPQLWKEILEAAPKTATHFRVVAPFSNPPIFEFFKPKTGRTKKTTLLLGLSELPEAKEK